MRRRDEVLSKGWGKIATPFSIKTAGGKQKLNCANTEGILRIIQSIPSPKAEPFKRWLAKVGYERIQEIENPELAQARMKKLYEQKGYDKSWIDKRLRGIAVRQNLTDEWQKRGITEQRDYAILTAEISKATFGITPSEYRQHKNLPKKSKANLRDNMTDLELIFTMLGERVTTEISEKEKPETFDKSKQVAKRGGAVAGNARRETEKEIGRSVISDQCEAQNYISGADGAKAASKRVNSSACGTGYFEKSGSHLCQAPKRERFEFMKNHASDFKIVEMASVLEVSVSGYYNYYRRGPSQRLIEDQRLMPMIKQAFVRSRQTYGRVRLCKALFKHGIHCGEQRIKQLMKQHGLVPRRQNGLK
jgi:DNA-damage-inducible protein D